MTPEREAIKARRIDRYDLQELIGEGGMGAVYRAVDSRLGRTVALKTVVPPRSGAGLTDELRQRFMREALAASKVEHRNVVQVLDFGVTGDGTPYLVMEYLRGQDLGVVLRKTHQPLAIEYVADVMLGVCAALRACHQLGIVHRDLKPSNIFLADTDTGHEIKVLDFGVSKAPMADDLTQEGQILGTPQYLSPEQVNGKVGPESDQYALGVLLYVCLTKRLPFEEHQNLSLLRAIEVGRFRGPRAHRAEIPPALEAIILRAMHANPAERFESVHVLGQKLWEFASSRGQVEWKNYYFHSPPVAMPAKATLRGVPLPPGIGDPMAGAAARVPASAPGEIEPTAVLASEAAPLTPGAPPSPQLFISTKLARPPAAGPDGKRIGTEPSGGDVGDNDFSATRARRRKIGLAIVVCLITVGVGIGTLRRQFRNSHVPDALASSHSLPEGSPTVAPPPPPPRTSAVSKLAPDPEPRAAPRVAAVRPAEVRPAEPQTEAAAPQPSAGSHKKGPSVRKKHAPGPARSPKMGLDQNGIGIPTN